LNKLLPLITFSVLLLIPVGTQNASAVLLQTFDDPTVTGSDFFGVSVALEGNNVLVGAPEDNTNGVDVGQVHLFDATTGALLRTFDDPTVTAGDLFGGSVALEGNNVLVGARGDDTNGVNVGQAHLFDATTGALLRTFDDPTVTGSDFFGVSVALEGNNVLVGAFGDDTNGVDVGQVHLFDATTGALLRTFDDPTVTGSDLFGGSVALEGNLVLVGATGDDTNGLSVGQAHLFDATTGALLRTFDDPTVTAGDVFGFRVSISGNDVLIGAPGDDTNGVNVGQAHLFDATTGALLRTFDDPTVTVADLFGISVALEGNNVLVGARGDGTNGVNVGQVHLFDATTFNLLQTFDDPTVTVADLFGGSVALEGNNVLVGATGDDTNGVNVGQAHLFEHTSSNQVVGGKIIPIETTSLLLASAQSFSWMIPVVISGIGIGLFVIRRT